MHQLCVQIRKNLSYFVEDKVTLVITVLSIMAVMGMYVIVLQGFVIQMVENEGVYGRDKLMFADRLMVSGLLILVTEITCFGGIKIAIREKERSAGNEGNVSAMEPMVVATGYWIATAVASFFLTMVVFFISEFYFLFRYGCILSVFAAAEAVGILLLSSVINAGILLVISILIKDNIEYHGFLQFYGGILGFLAPIYLPYFFYGGVVKDTLYYLPCTQLTSLIRQICLRNEFWHLHNELTQSELLELKKNFGVIVTHHGSMILGKEQLSMVIFFLAILLIMLKILSANENDCKECSKRSGKS